MKWSVSVVAEGDRTVSLEEIVVSVSDGDTQVLATIAARGQPITPTSIDPA